MLEAYELGKPHDGAANMSNREVLGNFPKQWRLNSRLEETMSGKHGKELLEASLTWNFPFAPHDYEQPSMTYTSSAQTQYSSAVSTIRLKAGRKSSHTTTFCGSGLRAISSFRKRSSKKSRKREKRSKRKVANRRRSNINECELHRPAGRVHVSGARTRSRNVAGMSRRRTRRRSRRARISRLAAHMRSPGKRLACFTQAAS